MKKIHNFWCKKWFAFSRKVAPDRGEDGSGKPCSRPAASRAGATAAAPRPTSQSIDRSHRVCIVYWVRHAQGLRGPPPSSALHSRHSTVSKLVRGGSTPRMRPLPVRVWAMICLSTLVSSRTASVRFLISFSIMGCRVSGEGGYTREVFRILWRYQEKSFTKAKGRH